MTSLLQPDRYFDLNKCLDANMFLPTELSGTQQMFQDEFARSRRVTAVELGETKKLRGEVSDFKFEVADVSSAVTNLTTVIHTRLSNTSTGKYFYVPDFPCKFLQTAVFSVVLMLSLLSAQLFIHNIHLSKVEIEF